MYKFREWYIPERMMDGIERYVNEGILPGDFLQAIISNDLREACSRADDENLGQIPAYVAYFYNKVPSPCWGSPEKMKAWANVHAQKRIALAKQGGEIR